MKKLFMMSVVVVIVCFFAPLAMAIIIVPYSEEMCEGLDCEGG